MMFLNNVEKIDSNTIFDNIFEIASSEHLDELINTIRTEKISPTIVGIDE